MIPEPPIPPPDPAVTYMAGRGISEFTMLVHGVHYDAEHHAVAFPYHDALSRLKYVRRRALEPGTGPKYIQDKGVRLGLYNVADVEASDVVYLCEGEIDTLTLKEMGLTAVGVAGARSFREAWRWLFLDKTLRIAFDGDQAGLEGATRIMQMCSAVAGDVDVLRLPAGEDINSLYVVGKLGEVLG